MIRLPTPAETAFAWHSAALVAFGNLADPIGVRRRRFADAAVKNPALRIFEDQPQCGWYRRQLVKGGPFVDARIYLWQVLDDDGHLVEPEGIVCEVADIPRDAEKEWTYLAGDPIPESEFLFLRDNRRWAMRFSPHDPSANPEKRIDPLTAPLLF